MVLLTLVALVVTLLLVVHQRSDFLVVLVVALVAVFLAAVDLLALAGLLVPAVAVDLLVLVGLLVLAVVDHPVLVVVVGRRRVRRRGCTFRSDSFCRPRHLP